MEDILKIVLNGTIEIGKDDLEGGSKYIGRVSEVRTFLRKLVSAQHVLNMELCGEKYLETLMTEKGLPIRMGSALISESNELLDSTPWKHWKDIANEDVDTDNVITELIDILHFVPSILLIIDRETKNIIPGDDVTDRYINKVADAATETYMLSMSKETEFETYINELVSVTSILGGMINLHEVFNPDLVYSRIKFEDVEYLTRVSNISATVIGKTLALLKLLNVDIETVWLTYTVKNTLNSFRKMNGYTDGTYLKMWSGTEDNEVTKRIAKDLLLKTGSIDRDVLLEKLEEEYAKYN